MFGVIFWFVAGMVVASVIWFFVWRNNKDLIRKQAEKIDTLVTEIENKIEER